MSLKILSWNIKDITSNRIEKYKSEMVGAMAEADLIFVLESTQIDLDFVMDSMIEPLVKELNRGRGTEYKGYVLACGGGPGGSRPENTIMLWNNQNIKISEFGSILPDFYENDGVVESDYRAATSVFFEYNNRTYRVAAWHAPNPRRDPFIQWQKMIPTLNKVGIQLILGDFNFTSATDSEDGDGRPGLRKTGWQIIAPTNTTTFRHNGDYSKSIIDKAYLNLNLTKNIIRGANSEVLSVSKGQEISDHVPLLVSLNIRG